MTSFPPIVAAVTVMYTTCCNVHVTSALFLKEYVLRSRKGFFFPLHIKPPSFREMVTPVCMPPVESGGNKEKPTPVGEGDTRRKCTELCHEVHYHTRCAVGSCWCLSVFALKRERGERERGEREREERKGKKN